MDNNTKSFAVTGTFHGSIVDAESEGEARRIFHRYYNGESIIHCNDRTGKNYWKNIIEAQTKLEQ